MPAIEGCRDGFQSSAPWVLGARNGSPAVLGSGGQSRSHSEGELLRPAGILSNWNRYSAAGLKLWSTVFVSFAATVTFWSCSPSFSCTNAIV